MGGAANSTVGDENIIAGNLGSGVVVSGIGTSNNTIQNNKIGCTADGTVAIPNSYGVVLLAGTQGNWIFHNQISGNQFDGVFISAALNNKLTGNLIGTDARGTAALPNNGNGVTLTEGAQDNLSGEANTTFVNLLSGNSVHGLLMSGTATTNNRVQNNRIGTNLSGLMAIANGLDGVRLENGASGNFIGGDTIGSGNLLSGNARHGIYLGGTAGGRAEHNVISGNSIGTDLPGKTALPNADGILLDYYSRANSIVKQNVIAGNRGDGITINGDTNSILDNFIGRPAARRDDTTLANGGNGITVSDGNGNRIGAGNDIAFNRGYGVHLPASWTTLDGRQHLAAASGTTIRANSIRRNGKMGINQQPLGEPDNTVTPVDARDIDTGPNGLQNFPQQTSLVATSTGAKIGLTLNSTPNRTFLIDFYRNTEGDPSLFGEGEEWLSVMSIKTDATGVAHFTANVPRIKLLEQLTSVATDQVTGDSSEFSRANHVRTAPPSSRAPIIETISPERGLAGSIVTITGINFNDASSVLFGGIDATRFTVTPTQIRAVVPANARSGAITVTTPNGRADSAAAFTVLAGNSSLPSITNFLPQSGAPGQNVVIVGVNLANATSVTFNGIGARFTVLSNTQIRAVVPIGARTGLIRVTTPSGSANTATPYTIRTAPPLIISFSPSSAIVSDSGKAGGFNDIIPVSIVGRNFTGVSAVFIGRSRVLFDFESDTRLRAFVSPGVSSGKISVTNRDGTFTTKIDFVVERGGGLIGKNAALSASRQEALSPLRLSSAHTDGQMVRLIFSGALEASADEAARYLVSSDGEALAIEGVQLARDSVQLLLPAHQPGKTLRVQWNLRDASGKALRGETTLAVP